jgi:predicted CoA-binding protein
MNQAIQDFINCKNIAVVGVSRNATKFGNLAYKELKQRGYQVYAVNPAMKEFQGEPCYPDLSALQGKVDGVLLTVRPDQGKAVLEEASRVGIKNVWVQQQADNPALLESGRQLGLNLVSGKCILMYAPPVHSFHKFHRTINMIFGKL